MFSASQSGFSTIEVYDLGPLNKIDLSIAKAGLEDAGGTVTFSVEQSLLDSLNNADGTSYQLLPPECYTIENATYSVSPGGDRRVTGGSLVYDPHKIYNLCGFDELKYVLPLRVSSTGTPMNSDRTAALYGFIVKEAIVRLASTGGDFVIEGGTTTSPMNLDTEISFENEWDLTTSFAAKGADYVDNYNSANPTSTLFPMSLSPRERQREALLLACWVKHFPPEIIFFRFHSVDLAAKEMPAST